MKGPEGASSRGTVSVLFQDWTGFLLNKDPGVAYGSPHPVPPLFYACRSRCILCELSHFHRGYVVKYKSTTKALRRTQGGLMIFLDLSKGDFYNALKAFVQCITFTPPSSGVEKRGSSIALDSTNKVCV